MLRVNVSLELETIIDCFVFLRCFNSVFDPIGESLNSSINTGHSTSSTSDTIGNDTDLEVVEVAININREHQWTTAVTLTRI